VVLNQLFSATAMESTFAVVLLALVHNQKQPKILSLREILDEYISYQEQIITRRTRFDLKKARERAHLLEGLLIAQDNIDEIIKIIRSSYDNAKENLMERFGLSEIQAQAILDMQLKRLQGLEKEKLEAEYKEIEEKIAYYEELLSDETKLLGVLKEELLAIAAKYGDDRKTEIQPVDDEIDVEDLIEEEDCCYTMSEAGYIKRMPVDTYKAQRRGGRGINAQSLKDEDFVKNLFIASTHDYVLFFTNAGKVHRKKGYMIPEASRTARGTNIVNILPLENGEQVTAMLLLREFKEDEYLVMVTRKGTVKRLRLTEINTARKAGIRALSLEEGDELISVSRTNGEKNIIIGTHQGMAICFSEKDVRPMGRDATGVRGIELAPGDYVVGAEIFDENGYLLSVTEKGYGKRTAAVDYMRTGENGTKVPQKRGGKGLKSYNLTEKTGEIAGVRMVTEDNDVMLISSDGTIIRMPATDINVYKRDTQGVIVMRVENGSKVISIEKVDSEKEEPAEKPAEETTETV
jgi:DNA gyrase subunit A